LKFQPYFFGSSGQKASDRLPELLFAIQQGDFICRSPFFVFFNAPLPFELDYLSGLFYLPKIYFK